MDEKQTTTFYDVQERYERDPKFRQAVELILDIIIQNKFTPGEMRDAAFLASAHFELYFAASRKMNLVLMQQGSIYVRDDLVSLGEK